MSWLTKWVTPRLTGNIDIRPALKLAKRKDKEMSIYRVDIKPRVIEANSPYEAALKAGCVPSGCTVTDITREIIDLQESGDIEIVKGQEIKG